MLCMSAVHDLCCLRSVKKQKHDFRFSFPLMYERDYEIQFFVISKVVKVPVRITVGTK